MENDKRQIRVEGMTCTNCALSVSRKLEKLGLNNIQVDFLSGEVNFSGDISFSSLSEELNKIGYSAKEELTKSKTPVWKSIEGKLLFSALFTLPLMAHMVLDHNHFLNNAWVQFGLSLPVVVLGIVHFGKSGWGSIRSGVANMDVLIFIGSNAAFIYSLWGTIQFSGTHRVHQFLFYETSATIITLVLLGNYVEHKAVTQTTSALRDLMKLQKTIAKRVKIVNGTESIEEVVADSVQVDDVLRVNSGDRIPIDGIIIYGEVLVDESMISGESLPVRKRTGDAITGGTLVADGAFTMKATRVGQGTTLAKIIAMVKEAQLQKPSIQKLGDKISSIFVPVVVAISVLTFLIAYFAISLSATHALMNAIAVLVISCPCAMGLATPTAVAAAIGRAAKAGILFKGADTIEQLAKVKTVVFDKTGTLTTGKFSIKAIHRIGDCTEEEIKSAIAGLEQHSSHPIAKSLVKELVDSAPMIFSEVNEQKGKGITGRDSKGRIWSFGSALLHHTNANDAEPGIQLYCDGRPIARIEIGDEIREGAKEMIRDLNASGIRTILLSGDRNSNCEKIANELGIQEWYGERLPDQKLLKIRELNTNHDCAMVGDGINDAPALAAAEIGISLGESSQIAIQSSQVVILRNDLSGISTVISIARLSLKTIHQNLFWAFFYNVLAIPVAAFGLLSPMIAALSMAFSDIIVVGNSIRLKFRAIR
ncbi:MAG TPA: cation-translocating P-type ATPase [Flavobacteriales bacterium]|nr:cation-translocating P-type ATPase [Flavobacteriales bacterium]